MKKARVGWAHFFKDAQKVRVILPGCLTSFNSLRFLFIRTLNDVRRPEQERQTFLIDTITVTFEMRKL